MKYLKTILKNFLSKLIWINYENPLKTWKRHSKRFPGPFRFTRVTFQYDPNVAYLFEIYSHDAIWKIRDEDIIEHEVDPFCVISLFRLIHIHSNWYYPNAETWEKMEEKELNLS